jgi:transportin-1
MSSLALMGDLARNAPAILEPALPQLLHEAIQSMDPVNPSVATNAVWSIGEICAKCEGNPAILEPFAPSILQNLIGILMGNGIDGNGGRGSDIPGLAENASACVGRLAIVNPNFVARDLSRFLLGWCDGMAKIIDPVERRDAYQGFVKVVYANPQAIQEAAVNVSDAITSILFAIITWHLPADGSGQELTTALFVGDYNFQPFPATEAELGAALTKLVQDIKQSVGEETWLSVSKKLPVNVRRLLREAYQS